MSRLCCYFHQLDDSSSNAGCRDNQKTVAMRITLLRSIQIIIYATCFLFLNFVYFDYFMPKWPKIPPKPDLLNANQELKESASNNIGKKILVDYDGLQPNSQHVLRENVIIVADRLLEIDNAENKVGDQVQVKNFWRFNQPVDSGDTRSLLDLQTKRKRRNANVIYIESPLVAILSGKHPNQGTNLEYIHQRKFGSPKSNSSGEKSKVVNQSIFKEKLYPSNLKTVLKVPDPGQSSSKSSLLLKKLQSSSSLSSSSLTTSQSQVSALRFNQNIRPTTLNDIFISVKTTEKFHESRLKIVLDTWFQYAKEQVNINLLTSLLYGSLPYGFLRDVSRR